MKKNSSTYKKVNLELFTRQCSWLW